MLLGTVARSPVTGDVLTVRNDMETHTDRGRLLVLGRGPDRRPRGKGRNNGLRLWWCLGFRLGSSILGSRPGGTEESGVSLGVSVTG